MEQRIGFVGLGNIGKPMAINLLRAGYTLTVHDQRPEVLDELEGYGARIAASALEVGTSFDPIAIAVLDNEQFEAVVLGSKHRDGVRTGATPGEKTMREIARVSTAHSWALEHIDAMRTLMNSPRQSVNPVAIGNKDLALAAHLGELLGIKTPIASFVSQFENE